MASDPVARQPRSFEVVAKQVAAMIRAEHPVGSRLPAERVLATRFGVSRPTLREAILALQIAGVLEVRGSSGAYVLRRDEPSPILATEGSGPFEMLQARQLIEPPIAALAAGAATPLQLARLAENLAAMRREHAEGREGDGADRQFHIILAETTGNGVLVDLCARLWQGQVESAIWREIHARTDMARHRPTWLADHEAVFRAVEAGEPRRASAAMARHLGNIRAAMMAARSLPLPASQD